MEVNVSTACTILPPNHETDEGGCILMTGYGVNGVVVCVKYAGVG
jgi:hypothetical protein